MKLTKNDIFPIKTDNDCETAVCLLEKTSPQDRNDALTNEVYLIIRVLVDHYDSQQPQLTKPNPVEILDTLMEDRGMTQGALAKALETRQPNVSRMLSGQHAIAKKTAEKLARIFRVPVSLFYEKRNRLEESMNDVA